MIKNQIEIEIEDPSSKRKARTFYVRDSLHSNALALARQLGRAVARNISTYLE